MRWILGLMPEILAGSLLLVPILLIFNHAYFHNVKKTLWYLLMGVYLIAVLCLVGFPNIRYFRFDPNVNLIPFRDMADGRVATVLNVIMFIPLGVFLPTLWKTYRKFSRTASYALAATLFIELSQLFTGRATDVDDLITNFFGCCLGYGIYRLAAAVHPPHPGKHGNPTDLLLLCGAVVFVVFVPLPYVYPVFFRLFDHYNTAAFFQDVLRAEI